MIATCSTKGRNSNASSVSQNLSEDSSSSSSEENIVIHNETPTTGLDYTLSSDGNSYALSGIGTATDTDIVIPISYNGEPANSIASAAFKNNTSTISVTIPRFHYELRNGGL